MHRAEAWGQESDGRAEAWDSKIKNKKTVVYSHVSSKTNEKKDGQGTLDKGQWTWGRGQWTMGEGQWTRGRGPWTMGTRQWTRDDGQGTMDNKKEVAMWAPPCHNEDAVGVVCACMSDSERN